MSQLHQVRKQVEAALVSKAQADPAFRQALLQNAKTAIEKASGVNLPANIEWKALEETATTNYLVLPARTDDELSDADLAAVAGGSLKLMAEILSNISKTRSEISMTFARNARA